MNPLIYIIKSVWAPNLASSCSSKATPRTPQLHAITFCKYLTKETCVIAPDIYNLFAGFYVVTTDKHLHPLSRQYHMESAPEPPSMDLHTHTWCSSQFSNSPAVPLDSQHPPSPGKTLPCEHIVRSGKHPHIGIRNSPCPTRTESAPNWAYALGPSQNSPLSGFPVPTITTHKYPGFFFEPQPPMPTGMPLSHLSHNHTGQASNSCTPTSGVKFPNDQTCTSTSRSQSLSYKLGMSYSHQLSNFYRTLHTLTPRAPAPLIL